MWPRHTLLVLATVLVVSAAAEDLLERDQRTEPDTSSLPYSSLSASAARTTITHTVTVCPSETHTTKSTPMTPPDGNNGYSRPPTRSPDPIADAKTTWYTRGGGPPFSTGTGGPKPTPPMNGTGGGVTPRPSRTPPVTAGAGRETVACMLALGAPGLAVLLG
ncbi:hypothetical protein GGTG_07486 [Gaeumannomyces tritici R3-111a-1]|uniref:Uncharacterized protein n=1 Tax=Gaeumannomyces tritici (strain R3-111a-1) TaxID=644352 RepID=J3P1T8_GAET3|nr:hypothetical protein GGTG_07486 [Gaeumannomyces tritici R3-111a-1]EJT73630.1 hypothetical protein GGTG_07486 [Gaeumannomyces tritici R3-111a-1]